MRHDAEALMHPGMHHPACPSPKNMTVHRAGDWLVVTCHNALDPTHESYEFVDDFCDQVVLRPLALGGVR